MLSFLQIPRASFDVKFPPLWHSAMFWAFASLVVHVCQRLVEHTAASVDRSSRKISASQAALSIGCMVWALDVAGFFMYEGLAFHRLDLVPALAALITMAIASRLTVPTLSTSTRRHRIILAGCLLAAGMVAAHAMLAARYVADGSRIQWLPALLSLALAACIACFTAMRHRLAKMQGLARPNTSANWPDWFFCGGAILVLHWLLINSLPLRGPLPPAGAATPPDGAVLVGMVLVFALAMGADQLFNVRFDQGRQHLFRQGLTLLRASNTALTPAKDAQLALIADHLDELLRPERLALYFQPIANLRAGSIHLEALLRISHARLGSVHPELFFLVCELQGRTAEVDRMILRNALDHAQSWHAGGQPAAISVNVAPGTLLADDFAGWLTAELERRELPQHALRLEMTEHAIIASGPGMADAMGHLDSAGIHVVMDDFGAGYSSLGVLADLPISGIKCDRLFLRRVPQDLRRQALLRQVAAMSRELGLQVIVEGVETPEELRIVVQSGIDSIQGYLFARPIPASDIPHWLASVAPARLRAMDGLLGSPNQAHVTVPVGKRDGALLASGLTLHSGPVKSG